MVQPVGPYTTDSMEIDSIVRRAWDEIYNGNIENLKEEAIMFMEKYDKHIYSKDNAQTGDINMDQVRKACRECAKSAPAPDGWEPAEMAQWSDLAFAHTHQALQ